MKKIGSIVIGALLIAAGVIFALNTLDIVDINVFFDGWWTLFIIIPCAIGLVTERDKIGNIIGIAIGVILLLCAQDIIEFSLVLKLAVPVAIAVVGIMLVVRGARDGRKSEKEAEIYKKYEDDKDKRTTFALFSSNEIKPEGEPFDGAELVAVFGGVECDLRSAIIEKDCVIKATAIFGGVDIFVPDGVNVKVKSTSIFGGVGKKKEFTRDAAVTIYIDAVCMFGGVDIK